MRYKLSPRASHRSRALSAVHFQVAVAPLETEFTPWRAVWWEARQSFLSF
jgi:hypothetical protein